MPVGGFVGTVGERRDVVSPRLRWYLIADVEVRFVGSADWTGLGLVSRVFERILY